MGKDCTFEQPAYSEPCWVGLEAIVWCRLDSRITDSIFQEHGRNIYSNGTVYMSNEPIHDIPLLFYASKWCPMLSFQSLETAPRVAGLCCRVSFWWAGECHLFYCPHRTETINAFLPPSTLPPSSVQSKCMIIAHIPYNICDKQWKNVQENVRNSLIQVG